MFLDDGQELSQRGAGPLGARFPLLDRAFARVEVSGEHALADIVGFAKLLNFGGRYFARDQMPGVEVQPWSFCRSPLPCKALAADE